MKVGNNDCFMKKHKDLSSLCYTFYTKKKRNHKWNKKLSSYDLEREQQILFCLAKLIEKN